MKQAPQARRWPVYAGFAISAALLGIVLYQIDRVDFASTFARLGAAPFALAVVGFFVASVAISWRFGRAVGRLVDQHIGFLDVFMTYLPIVLATNLLAHGLTIGAEIARLVFLRRRHGLELQVGLGVLIVDRLVGVGFAASLAALSLILVFWPASTSMHLMAVIIFLVFGLAAAIMARRAAARLLTLVRWRALHAILKAYLGGPLLIAEQLAVAVAATAGLAVAVYAIASGIGTGIPLGIAFAAAPLVYVGSSVPFTYAGWGSREITCIATLAWTGWMTPADAVVLSVTLGIAAFVASLPGLIGMRQGLRKAAPPLG